MDRTPETPDQEPDGHGKPPEQGTTWDSDYAREPLDQPGESPAGAGEPPDPPANTESDPAAMGLLDHVAELRTVLFQTSLAGLAATILCWFWSARLLNLLILPIKEQGVYFTAPNEAFLVRLKISAAVGLFVVAPFIFFKLYGFVLPGLYRKERKVVTPLLLSTTLLFYTGVSFAFLVVIPQVIRFLLSFGTEVMEPLIGVGPYFGFVTRLCLAFGLVFQLPLLVLVLSAIGLVKPRMLLRTWRYAIVLIFVLSAALTPPDLPSQVMMAGPVLVLYFGSVLVSLVVTRRRGNED